MAYQQPPPGYPPQAYDQGAGGYGSPPPQGGPYGPPPGGDYYGGQPPYQQPPMQYQQGYPLLRDNILRDNTKMTGATVVEGLPLVAFAPVSWVRSRAAAVLTSERRGERVTRGTSLDEGERKIGDWKWVLKDVDTRDG
ncbi:hypothetical protein Q7P37_006570 [Cladosporium fusiforme]